MENQWQPIETCPEGVRVFVWLKSTTNKEYVGQRIEAIKMQNKYGWDCHELWVLEDLMAKNKYFSHWMPLPKPPVIKT